MEEGATIASSSGRVFPLQQKQHDQSTPDLPWQHFSTLEVCEDCSQCFVVEGRNWGPCVLSWALECHLFGLVESLNPENTTC